ncbi:DUF7344 domain-containing protein [Halomarina rubra]|uniref:DUF7344 domain-containing protein n=1 Tax=Halomarina rubra TaxID=2071873 RepID=A0ABD6AWZ6_9EURY|nr:hypothetical protein [Halomarina rubra]
MNKLGAVFGVGKSESHADTTSEPLTEEEVFTILGNERRFAVLDYLTRAGGPVVFDELVEAVAADEFGISVTNLDRKQERRVYVALHQNHLPYLENEGLVTWDRSEGIVRIRDSTHIQGYVGTGKARRSWPARSALVFSFCSLFAIGVYLATGTLGVGSVTVSPISFVTILLLVVALVTWATER